MGGIAVAIVVVGSRRARLRSDVDRGQAIGRRSVAIQLFRCAVVFRKAGCFLNEGNSGQARGFIGRGATSLR